jgi:hypothetical protein
MLQIENAEVANHHTAFGYLSLLKNSIEEESKNCGLLMPFLEEIQSALEVENYAEALHFIDELEEFMDLEFCKKSR